MTDNSYSSRTKLLDAANYISQAERSNNHFYEFIAAKEKEMEENDLIEADNLNNEAREEADFALELTKEVTDLRRTLMKLLEEELQTDPKLWCPIKHIATMAGLAEELEEATTNKKYSEAYREINYRTTKLLFNTLRLWTKQDITFCARCDGDKEKTENVSS